MTTTQMSGSMGAITWSAWEYYKTGKWSIPAMISGAIAGLVAITPGCGYVGLPASLLFGFLGGTACYWASLFKFTRLAQKIGWIDVSLEYFQIYWILEEPYLLTMSF